MVLGGERKCWNKNELLLEWVFLDYKDMVSSVCSLGSGEVCGPTEVTGFELGFNDEQDSNKKKEIWRSPRY